MIRRRTYGKLAFGLTALWCAAWAAHDLRTGNPLAGIFLSLMFYNAYRIHQMWKDDEQDKRP